MKQILTTVCAFVLVASQGVAQTPESSTTDDGLNLMEEGARLLLQGLLDDMQPAARDLRSLMDDFGPQLSALVGELGPRLEMLLALVDDIKHYDDPEMLPNGDIIIRRLPDAPAAVPPAGGEIEL